MENKLQSVTADGNLLAICDPNGTLKIWNTISGFLEHEFQPAEYLSSSTTCIQFSPKGLKSKKMKKRKESSELLLAMGTVEGVVLVYSHLKQEVLARFTHSQSSPVTDLNWNSSSEIVTLGQTKLIYWNVFTKEKLREIDVAVGVSLCILGENRLSLACNSICILELDVKSNSKKEFQMTGHKTSITQIVPILIENEDSARYVLSAAENDRFVYAWSTKCEHKDPVASFMVKDIVRTVSCKNISTTSISILVTTKKGHLRYFSHHLNGSKYHKPIKCEGSLSISSLTNENMLLPILGAYFLSSTTILIFYGTLLYPHCEKIFVKELQGDVKYSRKDPALFDKKKSSLVKTVTPHVSNDTVHLMPTQTNSSEMKEKKRKKGDEASELPMEERLDSLMLTKTLSSSTKGRPMNNYVHLLVQALRSKDENLLSNILLKGEEEEEVIHSTVRRLPVACVVPFLQYLQQIIIGKGIKNISFITWVKSVFYHHMSHLSSIPDKEEIMKPFYSVCASRTTTLPTITKLHSRISLLLTHVKSRHENAAQIASNNEAEALLVYKEESSDEEDFFNIGMSGNHSESEDTWDFLTEDDDENNAITDEENVSLSEKRSRKNSESIGNHEEDAISISENDEGVENDREENDVLETDSNSDMEINEQNDDDTDFD